MQAFLRIAVNVPAVSGEFDYALPPELAGQVLPGCLVTVPFGTQTVQGVVLEFVEQPAVASPKAVIDLLDPLPALTAAQIALARRMADSTLNPLAAMVALMLPPGLGQQADTQFSVNSDQSSVSGGQWAPVQKRLLDLLTERGPLRGRQIDSHFKNVDWRKAAQGLVRRGVLSSRSVLPPPRVRTKYIRTAQLAVPPAAAEAALADLGKTESTQKRRAAALRCLMRAPEALNVAWVYAESGCNLADLQELAERELVVLQETEIFRDPLRKVEDGVMVNGDLVELTPDQRAAMTVIMKAFDEPAKPILLHGVTGSGKTELYIRAAQEAVRRGRGALILVPEIALTPQTVRRFLAHFPGQVGLIHSKLSEGERYDTWRRARSGALKVVIGPRSALFAPLPDIGLIVLDECHDGSYRQSEPPCYDAVHAALDYAKIGAGVCILGSATPSVEQRWQADRGDMIRVALPQRLIPSRGADQGPGAGLPPIQLIDMREELKGGNRGIFSRALGEALAGTLERGEQAILFLNRRGTATYVFCRECGASVNCPKCAIPLTLHTAGAPGLLCHRCGYTRQMPKTCSNCGSAQIRAYGLGSEKVEAEVGEHFPAARVLRLDADTTHGRDAQEIILGHFAAGRADVLVGTQMLAKGLDLPNVTLVGLVLADVGLSLPDPFAAEKVFQVLTQAAGRAGRSERGGRVVLQTFQPEHYAIQAASTHDVDGFYARELEYRRQLGYPPFGRLVRVEFRHTDPARAEAAARKAAEMLSTDLKTGQHIATDLIGPAPCFFAQVGGVTRWQVVLRGPGALEAARGLKLEGARVEVDPGSLL
jgi:primosomal protein N' (replication factor Y)